jgi:hypothetical protein
MPLLPDPRTGFLMRADHPALTAARPGLPKQLQAGRWRLAQKVLLTK